MNSEAARDDALELAITQDPNDLDGYLVYGDWLLGQGDPRGELIAMQEAARRKQAKRSDVEAFIDEHAAELLGDIVRFENHIKLTWGLGFFYAAKLAFSDPRKMLDGLEVLLAHPSACFLQDLRIDPLGSGAFDFEAIERLLVETGPRSLRRVSVGYRNQWTVPEHVHEALPNLRQKDDDTWAAALERIASFRKLKVSLDPAALPALRVRDSDLELDVDPAVILLGLRMELDKRRDIGLVEAMRQVFTNQSLDLFAVSLMRQWMTAGCPKSAYWAFEAVGLLGGEHTAAEMGSHLESADHHIAERALRNLARMRTEAARAEIIALAIVPSRRRPRRELAARFLGSMATNRDTTITELCARTCPRALVAAAHDRITVAQRRWLFELMIHGDRLDRDLFLDHVAHHSVRGPLAAGLLWADFAAEAAPFRLDPARRNSPVDSDGQPVSLPATAQIGVVHPVELADDVIAAWTPAFVGQEQTLEQLGRTTFTLQGDEPEREILNRFAEHEVSPDRPRRGFLRADWEEPPREEHSLAGYYGRDFRRGPVTVVARTQRSGDKATVARIWAQAPNQSWLTNQRLALGSLHPVVVSEVLRDLYSVLGITAASSPAAPSAESPTILATPDDPNVLPQRGRYPFAELAKSSRSKCVICSEKIEKQTVRVGVERVIETPNFTGKATAWLHPDCMNKCPELRNMTDVDARLTQNSAGAWPPS